MTDEFLSEPLLPDPDSMDTSRMALGEPGLPRRFRWRGEIVDIVDVVESWRSTGACSHGSDESYVRKHWYEVDTAAHGRLKIYFERQGRSGPGRAARGGRGAAGGGRTAAIGAGGANAPRWFVFSRTRGERTG
jgi:hypothetical protein